MCRFIAKLSLSNDLRVYIYVRFFKKIDIIWDAQGIKKIAIIS